VGQERKREKPAPWLLTLQLDKKLGIKGVFGKGGIVQFKSAERPVEKVIVLPSWAKAALSSIKAPNGRSKK